MSKKVFLYAQALDNKEDDLVFHLVEDRMESCTEQHIRAHVSKVIFEIVQHTSTETQQESTSVSVYFLTKNRANVLIRFSTNQKDLAKRNAPNVLVLENIDPNEAATNILTPVTKQSIEEVLARKNRGEIQEKQWNTIMEMLKSHLTKKKRQQAIKFTVFGVALVAGLIALSSLALSQQNQTNQTVQEQANEP